MRMRPKPWIRRLRRVPHPEESRWGFLRLDKNEGLAPFPRRMLADLRRRLHPRFLQAYPEPPLLYRRIARSVGLTPAYLYVCAGSDAAIKAAFEVFVKPGDEVVLPEPTYAMYSVYGRMMAARIRAVPYRPAADGFRLGIRDLLAAVHRKTRLVCLPNPNSPTGTVFSPEELRLLARRCGRLGVPLLVDEAYYPYHPKSAISWVRRFPNLIVTRTFSKAWGLSGGRLGFAAASPPLADLLRRVRPIYEVNGPAVWLGLWLLDHPEFLRRSVRQTMEGKRWLEERFRREGYPVAATHTNFVLARMESPSEVARIVRILRRRRILVRQESGILASWLRVTAGPPVLMQTFWRLFRRIVRGLDARR